MDYGDGNSLPDRGFPLIGGSGVSPDGFPRLNLHIYIYALRIKRDYEYG